jgi:hypothetical protein
MGAAIWFSALMYAASRQFFGVKLRCDLDARTSAASFSMKAVVGIVDEVYEVIAIVDGDNEVA